MIDQASEALKVLTGAKSCELFKLQGMGQGMGIHLSWDLNFQFVNDVMKNPKKFAEVFSEFWDEATKVIGMPRVKELEAEKRSLEERIKNLEDHIEDLKRYKTAYELS